MSEKVIPSLIHSLPLTLLPCPVEGDESGPGKGEVLNREADKIRTIHWKLYFCSKYDSNDINAVRKEMSLFFIPFKSNAI